MALKRVTSAFPNKPSGSVPVSWAMARQSQQARPDHHPGAHGNRTSPADRALFMGPCLVLYVTWSGLQWGGAGEGDRVDYSIGRAWERSRCRGA